MNSVLFLFIDGLGIGAASEHNLFSTESLPGFEALSNGSRWVESEFGSTSNDSFVTSSIDARLGVPGLPQSGTGQSTIFTGVNCAALADRHYGPFPHSTSRELLRTNNVYHQIKNAGVRDPRFLNAYPNQFFERAKVRDRWSVTTRCCLDANIPISTLENLNQENAVSADLTGEGLASFSKEKVQPISIKKTAAIMSRMTQKHRFCVFEFFHTDKAGHAQEKENAVQVIRRLDQLFSALLSVLDLNSTTLVVSSDHGNIEDLSTRTHTLNPVPLVAAGNRASVFKTATDLTSITPAIIKAISG